MNRKLSIGLLAFIFFLIVFDAVQQKYYMESFNLLPDGEVVLLSTLLKNHFTRWLAWGIMSVPSGFLIWKVLPENRGELSMKKIMIIAMIILVNAALSVTLISFINLLEQDRPLTYSSLMEFMIFFTFQKGLAFLMASVSLTMILFIRSREETIKSQFVEISTLKRKSTDLEEALNMTHQMEPHLNIKTGNRLQPIPLSDIVWIQSDDYCVRIHTENQVFTLRKSMKSLEEQLKHYSFIRVHRAALLNLNFLQQINFESATIKLSNTTELPLSRTGAKALKEKLEQSSL